MRCCAPGASSPASSEFFFFALSYSLSFLSLLSLFSPSTTSARSIKSNGSYYYYEAMQGKVLTANPSPYIYTGGDWLAQPSDSSGKIRIYRRAARALFTVYVEESAIVSFFSACTLCILCASRSKRHQQHSVPKHPIYRTIHYLRLSTSKYGR